MKWIIVFLSLFYSSNAIFYDAYHGNTISKEELKRHDKSNTTFWCTTDVEPCSPNEGRRVDGSCNNLDHPTRGTGHTPFVRILPAVFVNDDDPRKAVSGRELPLARRLRTGLLSEGSVPSLKFTQLAIHFMVFMAGDIVSQHDTINYIQWKPYCCTEKGKADRQCIQIKVPDDDPVHRFSDIRCLNLTRPETFQSIGCIGKKSTPARISSATPLLDLSAVYGASEKKLNTLRVFERGLLKTETLNGNQWPPSTKSKLNVCFLNDVPTETRCHDGPDDGINTLAGVNMLFIWFWRNHNYIAENLSKVNPCWDDQKLFDTARDINIAIALQIYYYEILPLFLGRENLLKDEVISPTFGFRDVYLPTVLPQMSLEYPYVLRWLHTMQEGTLKMYNTDGAYMKQIPIVNLTLRTGYFAVDDNMVYMTQGSFRQGSAAADYIVDSDIANVGLGPHQKASDLPTSDLTKSRYFGFQPYIKYREICFGQRIKYWRNLNGIIDPERIEILKNNYESLEDVDLMAGIWLEKLMAGGNVPPTMYCVVVDQLRRNLVSDRHWFERPNRPNAFTFPQLLEIRKMTIARVLCDVGDSVSEIQASAFSRINSINPITSCSQIKKMDFSMWKDFSCGLPSQWNLPVYNTYGR